MNIEQKHFFDILNKAIHGTQFFVSEEESKTLSKHFLRQDMAVMVCGGNDKTLFPMLQKKAMEEIVQFYRIFSFFRELNLLLQKENIHYYVLKGFGLCALYPREEMRCMSDVDIYVPNEKDFEKIQQLFAERNYQISSYQVGHHTEYYCVSQGDIIKCEVHRQLVDSLGDKKATRRAEKIFLEELGNKQVMLTLMDVTFPVLPPTLDLWYNLMHMLHHFIGYGIGIRPLCDITLFVEKKGNEVDKKQLQHCLQKSGMQRFANVVFSLCKDLFHLEIFLLDKEEPEDAEAFLEDLWTYDEETRLRERSPIDMNNSKLVSYISVCHRQMKYHFPKVSKVFLFWPVLWTITIYRFVKDSKTNKIERVDVILQKNDNRRNLAHSILKKGS